MSELKNDVNQMNVRGQMNLLYTLCRAIANLMQLAQTSQQARETMLTMAETLLQQAAILYTRVEEYTCELTLEGVCFDRIENTKPDTPDF